MSLHNDLQDRLQRALGDAYHLQTLIGEGGVGVVYSAWDVQLERPVAVKTLKVKPENIMLEGRDEQVMLMDFGIVKAVQESRVTKEHWYKQLSDGETTFGSPEYMSPEQISADPGTDSRSDVYSLGIVAYEMLAGRKPITGPNYQIVFEAQVNQEPENPRACNPAIPEALSAAIMRCVRKVPAERWDSAGELIRALDEWAPH